MTSEDPLALNRAFWDERVPIHVASAHYDVDAFRAGEARVVDVELEQLGPVEGLDLVHLQCHFGLATLDLARRGARVTGLDFSAPAIAAARGLAAELGLGARFEVGDVYDAPAVLGGTYDVVHTGLGALSWLPDMDRWAAVVAALLRPGGFLHLSEFHPVGQIMADDALVPTLPYFGGGPLDFDEGGTYAEREAATSANRTVEWIHSLSAVIGALLANGLVLETFVEHPHAVYQRFPFLERDAAGGFRFPEGMPGVPLMYSLRARRPGPPA
ncbi:MAG: class I SAM-dependent methyltransferase [Thermoleophilia bacterium]